MEGKRLKEISPYINMEGKRLKEISPYINMEGKRPKEISPYINMEEDAKISNLIHMNTSELKKLSFTELINIILKQQEESNKRRPTKPINVKKAKKTKKVA